MNDKTLLTPTQRSQLETALQLASQLTDCRVHLHLQAAAKGYICVSLAIAGLITLLFSLILVIIGLGVWPMIGLQLACFAGAVPVLQFSGLTHRLTPDFIKEALANHSLGAVLQTVNSAKQRERARSGDVLVMVSNLERFSRVIPSRLVAAQVPESVWQAINNSLMIDVGHGEPQKGMQNSTHAITKLLKVYFPKSAGQGANNGGHGTLPPDVLTAQSGISVAETAIRNRLVVVA